MAEIRSFWIAWWSGNWFDEILQHFVEEFDVWKGFITLRMDELSLSWFSLVFSVWFLGQKSDFWARFFAEMDRMTTDLTRNGPVERDIEQVNS